MKKYNECVSASLRDKKLVQCGYFSNFFSYQAYLMLKFNKKYCELIAVK